MTTDMAAIELEVTRWAVLKAIKDKRLTAEKMGRDYLIARDELDRFKRERRGRGRPRKSVEPMTYPMVGDHATGRLKAAE